MPAAYRTATDGYAAAVPPDEPVPGNAAPDTTQLPRYRLERQLAIQYAVARAFAQGERLSDVSGLLLDTLVEVLDWETAALWVPDEGGRALRCADTSRRSEWSAPWVEHARTATFAPGAGLPGRVWAGRHAIWVRDTDDEANFPRRDLARTVGLRHGIAFPVLAGGSVRAVVELFAADVRDPDEIQTSFLEAVGHQLGSFLARIEASRAVGESEARKAGILSAAVDGIVSADASGRILEFNPAAERLFGRTRAEVVGRLIADVIVPDELRATHTEALERYLDTGEPRILGRRVRTTGKRADGSTFPVELTVTEVRLEDRPMFTAFIRDISREREAETARDRFLEILSHELRTPVTSIYGGASLLTRPTLDPEQQRSLLEDIVSESDRLHRLVEDLIILARAERGARTIDLEPVHLDRVTERVVANVRGRWPRLEFRLRSIGDRRAVDGDETSVEQVLRNLLSNAAKYGAAGRRIDVEVDHSGAESIVRVLDEGPGIEPAEAQRLFEIDYRSSLTNGLAEGSGIGLFVARWLVEGMGGRIWAERRPGVGSEFGFALQPADDTGEGERDRSSILSIAADDSDASVD